MVCHSLGRRNQIEPFTSGSPRQADIEDDDGEACRSAFRHVKRRRELQRVAGSQIVHAYEAPRGLAHVGQGLHFAGGAGSAGSRRLPR